MKFLALLSTVAAITDPKVDAHNWPGTILSGDRAIPTKPSSFVDDGFNPMFNRFRYSEKGLKVADKVLL